ncbi:hypothetical protein HPG69_009354, partial [Diceros bicornis minor]
SEKDTLQSWFEQTPYPGIATREQLTKEIGILESRIQVKCEKWPKSPLFFLCSPLQCLPKEARKKQTSISQSPTGILVQVFEKNQFPGTTTREELAGQTDIPESRIR